MSTTIVNGIATTRLRPQEGSGGGIPEAPIDGSTYGRKDGDWTPVTGGELEIIKCTNAANTPQGVQWKSGSTTITGTLVASEATKGKLYFVPLENGEGKDLYAEYVTLKDGSVYSWEKLGETPEIPQRNDYFSIEKVQPNLYDVKYDSLDYDAALAYFAGTAPALNLGGCSTIVKNGFAGRNYDWHNNKGASFEVHTPNAQGHFKVFGIAGGLADLTVAKVESREYSDLYKILPFYLVDGMNEKKLFAEVNVVPTKGNTRTVPLVEKRESICSLMLVRYILDNFESVSDAVDYINGYVEVYFPQGLLDMGYETHWMLRDASSCVVLEIADNTIVAVASNKSTNFHVTGVTFGADGSVYTNADVPDGNLPTSQGIDSFGMGLERWNLLNAGDPTDKATMAALMRSLFYSKTYTELTDVWYSEFTGGTITVDTLPTDTALQNAITVARQAYADDSDQVDITVHSIVYDLDKCEAYVVVQERADEHKFALGEIAVEIPQEIIYGYLHEGTFYKTKDGSTYSDAVTPEEGKQYTDRDADVAYIWDGAEFKPLADTPVIITSAADVTVNSQSVPGLTAQQVSDAYDAALAGKVVRIVAADGHAVYGVLQADKVSNTPSVGVLFKDKMVLTYTVNGTGVDVAFLDLAHALKISDLPNNPASIVLNSEAIRTYQICTITTATSITLSGGNANPGYEHFILFHNTGTAACVLAFPTGTLMDDNPITIAAGKYLEINWLWNGTEIEVLNSRNLTKI